MTEVNVVIKDTDPKNGSTTHYTLKRSREEYVICYGQILHPRPEECSGCPYDLRENLQCETGFKPVLVGVYTEDEKVTFTDDKGVIETVVSQNIRRPFQIPNSKAKIERELRAFMTTKDHINGGWKYVHNTHTDLEIRRRHHSLTSMLESQS